MKTEECIQRHLSAIAILVEELAREANRSPEETLDYLQVEDTITDGFSA